MGQVLAKRKGRMTVPCHARKSVNNATGTFLPVETEENEVYMFYVKKKHNRTVIYGDEYEKFLKDFDMKAYDRVFIDVGSNHPRAFISAEDNECSPKERVKEPYVFEGFAQAVVISKGLEPTGSEIAKINKCVVERGIGIGAVFIHRLTSSDVEQNCMHIPKHIASFLGIPWSGFAALVKDGEDFDKEAFYYTSKDGRIRFKHGWEYFVAANQLKARLVVLVMFHLVENNLDISVDVVGC